MFLIKPEKDLEVGRIWFGLDSDLVLTLVQPELWSGLDSGHQKA